jgi:hypothetical protein
MCGKKAAKDYLQEKPHTDPSNHKPRGIKTLIQMSLPLIIGFAGATDFLEGLGQVPEVQSASPVATGVLLQSEANHRPRVPLLSSAKRSLAGLRQHGAR